MQLSYLNLIVAKSEQCEEHVNLMVVKFTKYNKMKDKKVSHAWWMYVVYVYMVKNKLFLFGGYISSQIEAAVE